MLGSSIYFLTNMMSWTLFITLPVLSVHSVNRIIMMIRIIESDSLKFLFHESFVGLYLWKDQEFKIVEEVWPTLFFIFRGGHTSSTILNSWSFQRYRPTKLWRNKNSNESDSIWNQTKGCDKLSNFTRCWDMDKNVIVWSMSYAKLLK